MCFIWDLLEAGVGQRLPAICATIKRQIPNLQFSLTIGSTGSGGFIPQLQDLGKNMYARGVLNYLILMNYDQYWQPPSVCIDNFFCMMLHFQSVPTLFLTIQIVTLKTFKLPQISLLHGLEINKQQSKC